MQAARFKAGGHFFVRNSCSPTSRSVILSGMSPDYDVIVAGAGPAGATAALFARRAGLRVLLLDKKSFPRDKVCGDAIARKSIQVLRELGLFRAVRAQAHEPVGAAVLYSPNRQHIRVDLVRAGRAPLPPVTADTLMPHVVCKRALFDNVLVEAARSEMDVLEGHALTGLELAGDRVRGIVCRSPRGAVRRFSANIIVGADGYNSTVARKLGLYRFDSPRWFSAARSYYRGLDVQPNTVEIHFVEDILPGFLWMFPTGDGLTNVGLGMIHKDVKKRGGILRIHESIIGSPRFRARFDKARIVDPVRGWNIPTPDWRRRLHGNGFVLVGDAAGLVDPFSGEGIGNAMWSGKIAAELAVRACSAGDYGSRFLAEYPGTLWKTLDKGELKLHYRLRRLARNRALLDFLVGRAAARPDVLEWITSMTGEQDAVGRKQELVSPLTYLKLLLRRK